jgi:FkbM family methyltransferase
VTDRTHRSGRVWGALRDRRRAPRATTGADPGEDERVFTLRGVRLDLSEPWVTPRLREAICDGSYEKPEAQIIEATLKPTDRVLEIGCGVGFIATLASRIVGDAVRCYDANPAMVAATRRTLVRNGASAIVTAAVLKRRPTIETVPFYVREDFWVSSLAPGEPAAEIRVAVRDLDQEINDHAATYLVIDIEGGETDLLTGAVPASVRGLCVECHPHLCDPADTAAMLASLASQNFALSLEHTNPPVHYFERPAPNAPAD